MKKNILLLIFCFLQFTITLAQEQKLPVLKSKSNTLSIRDNNKFYPNSWGLNPNLKPDVRETIVIGDKPHEVTFISDIDSITFKVEGNKKYDFVVVKDDKPYYTQIDAKRAIPLQINKKLSVQEIKKKESQHYALTLTKDTYYAIYVEQKGIDLKVRLRNNNGEESIDAKDGFNLASLK
jgi:hypothetical protein